MKLKNLFVNAVGALLIGLLLPLTALAYEFQAKAVRAIDGDTFVFETELLNVTITDTCRMLGYNAPEVVGINKAEGLKIAAIFWDLIKDKDLIITAKKKEKYGRWLCQVNAAEKDINAYMKVLLSQ